MDKDISGNASGFGSKLFGYDKKAVNRYIAEADQRYSEKEALFAQETMRLENALIIEKANARQSREKTEAEKQRADAAQSLLEEEKNKAASQKEELDAAVSALDAEKSLTASLKAELDAAKELLRQSGESLKKAEEERQVSLAEIKTLKEEAASSGQLLAEKEEKLTAMTSKVSGLERELAAAPSVRTVMPAPEQNTLASMSRDFENGEKIALLEKMVVSLTNEKAGLAARIALLEKAVAAGRPAKPQTQKTDTRKTGIFFRKPGSKEDI